MILDHVTKGRRTMLMEGDLHVGTILELAKPEYRKPGVYQWYTAHNGGPAQSFPEAEQAIVQELSR